VDELSETRRNYERNGSGRWSFHLSSQCTVANSIDCSNRGEATIKQHVGTLTTTVLHLRPLFVHFQPLFEEARALTRNPASAPDKALLWTRGLIKQDQQASGGISSNRNLSFYKIHGCFRFLLIINSSTLKFLSDLLSLKRLACLTDQSEPGLCGCCKFRWSFELKVAEW
jgi:hypothetical protein